MLITPFHSAIWSIASACGPLLGGAFASFNYRLLFWINVPISFICALVCIFFMQLKGPEDNIREKLKKMDWSVSKPLNAAVQSCQR